MYNSRDALLYIARAALREFLKSRWWDENIIIS